MPVADHPGLPHFFPYYQNSNGILLNSMAPKDQSIIDVVQHLQSKYGADHVIVKDHWEADLHAIGLTEKSGQYLAYVSTYDKEGNSFYLSLESPSSNEDFPYLAAGEFENLDVTELESLLAKHLRLIS